MSHLAPAEPNGEFHLIALIKKALHGLHLGAIIMHIDIGAHLDLFDLDDFLLFTRLGSFFLCLIFELAKIKDFTDRRLGGGGNFDEIKTDIARPLKSVFKNNRSYIFASLVDELYFGGANGSIRFWSRIAL